MLHYFSPLLTDRSENILTFRSHKNLDSKTARTAEDHSEEMVQIVGSWITIPTVPETIITTEEGYICKVG